MFNWLGTFALRSEDCELQGQGPPWFWLALAITSLVAFEVHRRRNALRDTLFLTLVVLTVEALFLIGLNTFGTTDCNAGGPFGALIVHDKDWLPFLFFFHAPTIYLLSVGYVWFTTKATKNRVQKNRSKSVLSTRSTSQGSTADKEGDFRRYL